MNLLAQPTLPVPVLWLVGPGPSIAEFARLRMAIHAQ